MLSLFCTSFVLQFIYFLFFLYLLWKIYFSLKCFLRNLLLFFIDIHILQKKSKPFFFWLKSLWDFHECLSCRTCTTKFLLCFRYVPLFSMKLPKHNKYIIIVNSGCNYIVQIEYTLCIIDNHINKRKKKIIDETIYI